MIEGLRNQSSFAFTQTRINYIYRTSARTQHANTVVGHTNNDIRISSAAVEPRCTKKHNAPLRQDLTRMPWPLPDVLLRRQCSPFAYHVVILVGSAKRGRSLREGSGGTARVLRSPQRRKYGAQKANTDDEAIHQVEDMVSSLDPAVMARYATTSTRSATEAKRAGTLALYYRPKRSELQNRTSLESVLHALFNTSKTTTSQPRLRAVH